MRRRAGRFFAGSAWMFRCLLKFALGCERLHTLAMTAAAQHIVENFASLSDAEKREVLASLLRISRDIDYPEATDEELVGAADAVFLSYDRMEQSE